jgi:hypothetical protein
MRTHRIRNLDELVSTVEHIRLLLKKGTLVASSEQKDEDYFDVVTWSGKRDDLPDFFETRFRDSDTGETMVLYCDSYHGGGGAFTSEREIKRKDMIPKIGCGVLLLILAFIAVAALS